MIENIVGYSAITITALSFLPQIKQILKTKKVRDINNVSIILNITSCLLYIIYGSIKNDKIIIISVLPPIFVQLLMVYFIFKYKKVQINDISNNLQLVNI